MAEALQIPNPASVQAKPVVSHRLQRACECGEAGGPSGQCASCATDEKLGVQPKLTIGPPNDVFEQEADRVADQVVSGRADVAVGAGGVTRLQRQPEEEEQEVVQLKREQLQRQTDEEEETVQAKPAAATASSASGAQVAAAAVAQGGTPLSRPERAFFEPRFGRDLSHVRLHTDTGAGQAARGIGARAYTLRNHIAFAPGQYGSGTTEGRRLIAHELTHTLQQGFAGAVRRYPDGLLQGNDEFGEFGVRRDPFAPPHMEDPRGPRRSTLTYAQARELNNCIEVMGGDEVAAAECGNIVLGTPIPEWRSVAGISSPVPLRARDNGAGGVTHMIGAVTLTIRPDVQSADPAMQGSAKTEIIPEPLPTGTNLVSADTMDGQVTSFTVQPAAFRLSILTTFGPGVTAASISGYGRGTTTTDQAVGQTSLGFHEGEHGRDFITFLQDNPYPEFTGSNGQTAALFTARITQFVAARNTYITQMSRASALATDCRGTTTIDQFNAANTPPSVTTICVAQPGDPAP